MAALPMVRGLRERLTVNGKGRSRISLNAIGLFQTTKAKASKTEQLLLIHPSVPGMQIFNLPLPNAALESE